MKNFFFQFNEFLITHRGQIRRFLDLFLVGFSFLAAVGTLVYFGFFQHPEYLNYQRLIIGFQIFTITIFGLIQALRVFVRGENVRRWLDPVIGFIGLLLVVLRLFFYNQAADWFGLPEDEYLRNIPEVIILGVFTFFVFVLELGTFFANIRALRLNPPLVYLLSFLAMILAGTVLLLLPNSHEGEMTPLQAVFTSTSSVCVTGLIVVDTATKFTFFGKMILMFLIQLGGLGVMTFTTFFGYFFQGTSSLSNRFMIGDFLAEENVSKVFNTLIRVVLVTFGIELVGAFFIYLSIDHASFVKMGLVSSWDQIFFSIFHSISAFCNAGFSTLSDGLHDANIRMNYSLQLVIIVLIILGGLGFPIMFNYLTLIGYKANSWFRKIVFKERIKHKPRIININSKLALFTTAILLVFGLVAFMGLEWNHTLAAHESYWGKFVTGLFGAVTPRTAGFNTVPMDSDSVNVIVGMSPATLMLYLLLMWVGASPGSTGGGIKTTTFSLGLVSIFSLAKMKDRVELFRREINPDSIRRAFAVILLSVFFIGLAAFLLTLFESKADIPVHHLLFEAFSAYGTVGLSMGLTPKLSSGSHIVLIICMFMGRVGALTVLAALFRKASSQSYRYPKENIIIT